MTNTPTTSFTAAELPPIEVDLLVVGSGGGGLTAALTAAAAGKKVLLVEKLPTLGGTTAMSGGVIWIPNSPAMQAAGHADSPGAAWTYFDGVIGDCGPATSTERKRTYLSTGPEMMAFLREQGLDMVPSGTPDYYSSRAGGRAGGRGLESVIIDGKTLGADYLRMNPRALMPSLAVTIFESGAMTNAMNGWANTKVALRAVGRTVWGKLRGRAPLTMGAGLVAQLLHAARRHGVEIKVQTPLIGLTTDANGAVTGAVVRHANGARQTIGARDGVVLACGGFAHNAEMRARYQPLLGAGWSAAARGDEGDGIRAGLDVGAAVAQMDEAWWAPVSIRPDGQRILCLIERAKPHSIIVDAAGERFVREPAPYMEVCQTIFRHQRDKGGAVPCWFVFDARNRRRYPFGDWPAGLTPSKAIDAGYVVRADTLEELARRCGIDAAGLTRTVARYNGMCTSGVDEDFHRGEDPFEAYYGDDRVTPNTTMGSLEKPPFYAVALYPGDIGTNGGLLTDQHARVLRPDGASIPGLYATGNCSASVMGRSYPGPGVTIGPAMVFGFAAARHSGTSN